MNESNIVTLDGKAVQEPHFVTRSDPFAMSGVYHEGIVLDCAMSVLEKKAHHDYIADKEQVRRFLSPAEMTKPDAPHSLRQLLLWKMLRQVRHEWRRELINMDGWIMDEYSPWMVEYETTPFVHVVYDAGCKWEMHANVHERDTSLAINGLDYGFGYYGNDLRRIVKALESGQNLFGNDGIDTYVQGYHDWQFPVLGVKRLMIYDSFDGKNICTTYSAQGKSEQKFDKYRRIDILTPVFNCDFSGNLVPNITVVK